MATNVVIPVGGAQFGGCIEWIHEIYIPTLFSINDFAYIKADALFKGKITRICVKKIIYDNPIIYQDTLNEMWWETELISNEDAVALAEQYYLHMLNDLANANPCTLQNSQFRFYHFE